MNPEMFVNLISQDPFQYFCWIGFAVFSICVHESAHARMAVHFGDETPRDYIPLNPMRQMGPFSLVLLFVIGVAWGAVPVDPKGCGSRGRNALVSLAGPLANLALCALFALLSQTAGLWQWSNIARVFHFGSYVNGILCVLNLCPVPPLDGFGVIRAYLGESPQIQSVLNKLGGIGLLLLWLTPLGSMMFQYGGYLAEFFMNVWVAPFRFF